MFLDINTVNKNKVAAIDDKDSEITYGELCQFSEEFSGAVSERTLIFCLCENNIGALAGYIACQSNNIVPLLLGNTIDQKLLNELINIYEPSYIWVSKDNHYNFSYSVVFEKYGYCLLNTGYKPYKMNDKLSLLLTTSGSTGSPKLVRYKYGNLEANAKNVAKGFGWKEDDRGIINLPMHYTMGLNVINTHLIKGATLILTDFNLMSANFWKVLKEKKVTNFTGVPFSFELLSKLRFDKMDLPYLRTLAVGGGKLNEKLFVNYATYAERTGKRFFSTFGTTETSARMSFLSPDMALTKIGSIGKPFPEGEMFLLDADRNVITGNNVEGELAFHGPNVTMGYAQTKDELLLGDVWKGKYFTGDIARRDKDGYYYIVGRISRFLKLSGHRVSLDQCENLIKSEYEIECACTGSDDKMRIFITSNSMKEKVRKFISEKIGLNKSLFEVELIEKLPKNSYGKVMYKDLPL